MEPVSKWLISFFWLAWCVYWVVSARNVKVSRREESVASQAAHLGPLAIAALLIVARRPLGPISIPRFIPAALATDVFGVLLVALGLGFALWARAFLGRNWSATVTLKEGHELIRTGPYRWVRHPIYAGLLLGYLGTAVVRGTWLALFAVLLVFAAFWRKLRLEERWLAETFGDEYKKYKAGVAALIPFVL